MAIELPDKCPHENDSDCTPGHVYVAQVGELHKIGSTTREVHARMVDLRNYMKAPFHAKIVLRTHCARSLETALHKVFQAKLALATVIGRRDYFRLDEADLAAIGALTHYGGKELHGESVLTPEAICNMRELVNKLRDR